jgi:nucleoside-diphosphate-sugar epimerase
MVHGTVRDPGGAKNAHLAALGGAAERLRLFRADVLDYGAVAAAVAGCDGVFHVASPVPSHAIADPEVELLAPAVTGTANVLKACSEAKVRRVVVVSSLSAVMVNPAWPQSQVMDEACWSDVEFCRSTQVTPKKKSFAPCSPQANSMMRNATSVSLKCRTNFVPDM